MDPDKKSKLMAVLQEARNATDRGDRLAALGAIEYVLEEWRKETEA